MLKQLYTVPTVIYTNKPLEKFQLVPNHKPRYSTMRLLSHRLVAVGSAATPAKGTMPAAAAVNEKRPELVSLYVLSI